MSAASARFVPSVESVAFEVLSQRMCDLLDRRGRPAFYHSVAVAMDCPEDPVTRAAALMHDLFAVTRNQIAA